MIASVVVDIKSSNVDVVYSYSIPTYLEEYVFIGSRVVVPFAVRTVTGYVVKIDNDTEYKGTVKDIIEVLDYDKELNLEQVELALDLAKDTLSPMISCLDLMYPSFLKSKYRKFLTVKNFCDLDADVAMLFNAKGKIVINNELLQKNPKIKKELQKGNLELAYDVYSYGKRKYVKHYFYDESYDILLEAMASKNAIKKRVIDFVKSSDAGVTIDEIKNRINCSNYLIKSIEKEGFIYSKNILKEEKKEASIQKVLKNFDFNFEETMLLERFNTLSGKPFLLFSNDEQFKLDFYLHTAINAVANEQKVMILTPTLIMNFIIARYFKKYLEGYRVLTFSSDLSHSEYYDNFMEVKWNDFDIIITTKVGAFLPAEKLDLIIVVDEENNNYIGEYMPKYHAIEVMKRRSKYHNAKLVLSSASPSMEAYYNYSRAKYFLLKYIVKTNNEITLVDMHQQFEQDTQIISSELKSAIAKNLEMNNQIMLILNVRGYSNYMVCRNCGEVLRCVKCKIPLTYHQEKNETKCRYCGLKAESLYCPKCGNSFTMLGIGLEKVKDIIETMYPTARTILLDSEQMKDYEDFQDAMVKIETQEVDIILGTNNIISMINPNVKLISLLSIDSILNANDYRASEIAYGLIADASNQNDCQTIIQGHNIEHYSVMYGASSEYERFYDTEIVRRSDYLYPPFVEINRLIVTGDYKEMYHCCNYFRKIFRIIVKEPSDILGPTYNSVKKGAQLLIKHNDFAKVAQLVEEVKEKFAKSNVTLFFERYLKNYN